jgi:hypothetical protein
MGLPVHQVGQVIVRQTFARLVATGALVRRQAGVILRRAAEQALAEGSKAGWRCDGGRRGLRWC